MLDKIINLVRENAGPAINNEPTIPPDKKEQAIEATGTSIQEGIQHSLQKGNIKDLLNMFSGRADVSNNPVTSEVNNSFQQQMTNKVGLSSSQAGGLASAIIPMILSKLVNRTNDPNDKSFDIQDIFNQLSGGKTSGMDMGALLNKFKGGLDQDRDGDVDLNDLKGMFAGGGSSIFKGF